MKLLEGKIKDMEEERDCLRNTIAVNDMLYESFKERMRDKYLFERVSMNRMTSKEKRDEREVEKRRTKCDTCDLIGKTEAVLKSHKTMKHKEN